MRQMVLKWTHLAFLTSISPNIMTSFVSSRVPFLKFLLLLDYWNKKSVSGLRAVESWWTRNPRRCCWSWNASILDILFDYFYQFCFSFKWTINKFSLEQVVPIYPKTSCLHRKWNTFRGLVANVRRINISSNSPTRYYWKLQIRNFPWRFELAVRNSSLIFRWNSILLCPFDWKNDLVRHAKKPA